MKAGTGSKPGAYRIRRGHGETDEYSIKPVRDAVHNHDFHASLLHLLGFDHAKLTYRHSGRDYRLTDVSGSVVRGVLA